jgi:hypothetical protein
MSLLESKPYRSDPTELLSQLKGACLRPSTGDVTFVCGERKESVKAHKAILLIRCEYFHRLLSGQWAEGSGQQHPISIEESAEVFQRLLLYLYTGEVHVTYDTALPLVNAAKKYGLPHLLSVLSDFLYEGLSEETACFLHHYADFYGVEEVRDAAFEVMRKQTEAALAGDRVCFLSSDQLVHLLQQDDLVGDEVLCYLQ